jgi:hypothetical protein
VKTFLRLFAIATFVLATFTVQAGTVQYPAEHPVFKLELPDGWTAATDADGNLDVKANDKGDFDFSITPAPSSTPLEVKGFLLELAKTMGKEMKGFAADEIRNVTSPTGMKVMVLTAKGKMEDQNMIITAAAFAPLMNKYFVIMSIAEKGVDEAHDKAMGKIVNSIKAIE